MIIGLYAGTFDPIHNGHLLFAHDGIKAAKLDRVIIVAEKNPYRKKPHASWDHRQAMIERATESIENIDHDYAFASALAHNHTMQDILMIARKHYGVNNEFWFLVGSDIFEHIHTWEDMVSENEYAGFIVALRDDHTAEWLSDKINTLKHQDIRLNTLILESAHPHISSSGIRTLIASHKAVADLPSNVTEYIAAHNLYQ